MKIYLEALKIKATEDRKPRKEPEKFGGVKHVLGSLHLARFWLCVIMRLVRL